MPVPSNIKFEDSGTGEPEPVGEQQFDGATTHSMLSNSNAGLHTPDESQELKATLLHGEFVLCVLDGTEKLTKIDAVLFPFPAEGQPEEAVQRASA